MFANTCMFSGNGNYDMRYSYVQADYRDFFQSFSSSTSELRNIGEFRMIRPLYLNSFYDEEGFYHIECDSADLYAVGSTAEEAREDFLDELRDAWRTYVLGDPSDFHISALRYREWLKENIQGPGL